MTTLSTRIRAAAVTVAVGAAALAAGAPVAAKDGGDRGVRRSGACTAEEETSHGPRIRRRRSRSTVDVGASTGPRRSRSGRTRPRGTPRSARSRCSA
jgi:hypothetical protein